MTFVIVDLEWNGAWSKAAHGYFNEIIEIGAVKLGTDLTEQGRFNAVIRPQVSKKLSSIVTDLTNITDEELASGTSFHKAMAALHRFVGDGETALVTWSNTDLLVLMEDCRFFYKDEQLPFFTHYADVQAFCQKKLHIDAAHQPSLSSICEQLGIEEEGFSLHRAPDDAVLTAQVFCRLYSKEAFAPYLRKLDRDFYARLRFKPTPISDPKSTLIPKDAWKFDCPDCAQPLRTARKWFYRGRAFCADMTCTRCKKVFSARVQGRILYDGPEIRRKLIEKVPKEETPVDEK
ncbi:MAG: exonuclease domain-containing protein [Ruminococcaceae bacterium]|nr:exonuclease domain-containing protein [Oscillospiraceae bacterium]